MCLKKFSSVLAIAVSIRSTLCEKLESIYVYWDEKSGERTYPAILAYGLLHTDHFPFCILWTSGQCNKNNMDLEIRVHLLAS